MTQEDIPLFPVTNLTVGPIPRLGIVMLRPDFLTNYMQKPADAEFGRSYAMTPVQVRGLVELLESALLKLEAAPPPTGLGPLH